MRTFLLIIAVILFFILVELDDLNQKSEETNEKERTEEVVYQEDPSDVKNLTFTNSAESDPSNDSIYYVLGILSSPGIKIFLLILGFILPFVVIINKSGILVQ
ncbi:hypothetical protein IQ283_08895 (plasmid) [Alkalihalobacillus hwajinpoensis]|uniref:hypothetical protein n=1 Tax=Guptibacillus hwajinpoensis TaxID=208199 RepID=UPI0018838A4F|nr:hypothetical protein [Pseudalkalibacillus hwajinpoensis]MBF0706723.1 hypothetical protein [Pseudalkalibacillus hwajinpoensis]